MIRAKHLGNLSSSARSFLLSGSRGTAADGSPCTCPDEESCVSRGQPPRNEIISKNLPRSALALCDSSKTAIPPKAESTPKVLSTPLPLGRPDRVNSVSSIDAVQQDAHSSLPMSDQFVKAGIAAVSALSDIMNYKLPSSDGSGIYSSSKNYVVEPKPTKLSSNVPASSGKPIRRESYAKFSKPSSETSSGGNSTVSYSGSKDRGNKTNFSRGFKRVSNSSGGGSSEFRGKNETADAFDERRSIPEKAKSHSNGFISNLTTGLQAPVAKIPDSARHGVNRPCKDMRLPTGAATVIRPSTSSRHVVETVSSLLRQVRWGPAAEQALGNLNLLIDAYQANQVLKQLPDHNVALGFFYWLKRLPGFKHDGHTYTTMVGILGRARQFVIINRLIDEMLGDGCEPNVVTYNRLIHSYGRANYLKEAVNVFQQMQEAGCEPDRVTFCTLIDIHAKSGYLDVALDMYRRMQAAGLSPDTFTYSVMINCLGKAGHLASAQKLFCEMVDQGCIPNLVTYNILIAMQAKARNYETALKLYRDVQNAGFQPDKVTYSIVMEVLGHCGYLEEAEALFTEMKQNNWIPDEPVYGLLVDLWGKSGNVEKAQAWYQAMLDAGLRPNVPTCNSLLSAFLRVHRLSDAYNLLRSMVAMGLNPSLQTYTLLLSCCTEARSPYDMGFCGQLMAITGHPTHMFLLSMPSAGPDGQNVRDHVSRFLDVMHSEDRESKRGLIDSVVDFLHKSGLKEEAGSVWEVAVQKNVYPDAVREKSSCYWLINLHVMSDGTAVTALSRTLAWFRRQMLLSGICPSRIDIVTGWGRRSRVTGSSLVRQSIQELLNIFSFPFFIENGNSGCFIGCGEPLNRWLLQSYVERMHLL